MKNQSGKKLKILITAPSLDEKENVSGISTFVRQITKYDECEFIHFTAGRRDGQKVNVFWILKQVFLPIGFLYRILKEKIDVVHINTAFSVLSILRDFVLTLIAKFVGLPVILHLHGGRFLTQEMESYFLKKCAEEMLYTANLILVLSQKEKQKLLENYPKLNVEIFPNLINLTEIPNFEKHSNALQTIIFFGRIDENKGLNEIIETCRILKKDGFEFQFKVYGTGEQKDFFIGQMKEVLGEKFFYEGIVSGKEKWKVLAEADIFLLPSYFEGLPLSMLEALAAKCVVIASNVGSIGTVIEDGVNGFLVEPHETKQIIEEIKLLLLNKTDHKILQNNARKTIEERFSAEEHLAHLKEIYETVRM